MVNDYEPIQGTGANGSECRDQGGQWPNPPRGRRAQDCIPIRIQFTTLRWNSAGGNITLDAQLSEPPAFFRPGISRDEKPG